MYTYIDRSRGKRGAHACRFKARPFSCASNCQCRSSCRICSAILSFRMGHRGSFHKKPSASPLKDSLHKGSLHLIVHIRGLCRPLYYDHWEGLEAKLEYTVLILGWAVKLQQPLTSRAFGGRLQHPFRLECNSLLNGDASELPPLRCLDAGANGSIEGEDSQADTCRQSRGGSLALMDHAGTWQNLKVFFNCWGVDGRQKMPCLLEGPSWQACGLFLQWNAAASRPVARRTVNQPSGYTKRMNLRDWRRLFQSSVWAAERCLRWQLPGWRARGTTASFVQAAWHLPFFHRSQQWTCSKAWTVRLQSAPPSRSVGAGFPRDPLCLVLTV